MTYAASIFSFCFLLSTFFVWKGGGLNMVGENNMSQCCPYVSYMCPQMCSVLCAHNLIRFKTSSVNKANNLMKLSPQILLDIPHNSTFTNRNTNREGVLNLTTTTLPSNTNKLHHHPCPLLCSCLLSDCFQLVFYLVYYFCDFLK